MRALALILAGLAALLALPAAAQTFPALSGRVVDAANVIPPDVEAQLTAKLEALETQSQRQLVVATVPSLEGYEISDYGYRLGRAWGIGDEERNDGAILLVAPNEKKVRIEVGYGLEPVLTDGLSTIIIQNEIIPRFKDGDMAGGIVAGTDAIIRQLQLPAAEAQAVAAQADARGSEADEGFPIGAIFWIVFVLLFFVLPMFGGRRGRRYRRGGMGGVIGDIILWEAGKAVARGLSDGGDSSWGGGGFGGGGFGGGGFSGGGGSFGGGGASGSW